MISKRLTALITILILLTLTLTGCFVEPRPEYTVIFMDRGEVFSDTIVIDSGTGGLVATPEEPPIREGYEF